MAALPLLRRAVAGCDGAGRIMAGANRSLWPVIAPALGTAGLGEAWQACTTLREHRGDGHIAALLVGGLRGLEAHLLAAGTRAIPAEVLRDNRGWSEEEWDAGTAAPRRPWPAPRDGRATDAGRTLHAEVEDLTDRLAEPAYAALGDGALEDLHGALAAAPPTWLASGVLPFPNPMGLPARLARSCGGGPARHEAELLAQLARRHHLARVAAGVGVVAQPGGHLAGHLRRRRHVTGSDEDPVHARRPHGLGEGEARGDGEGPDARRRRTPRGTCR